MAVVQSDKSVGGGEKSSTPAWSRAELASDPHADDDKPEKVRRMFASIADRYDLNNRLHSLGRDQAWRRAAVRIAAPRTGETVLDVACGTGDLSRLFARSEASSVVGVDFCPQMLEIARTKTKKDATPIRFVEADAMDLPMDDHSVDIVSIAFGIRNVADPGKAIAEFRRVLRPGGRLVILEFSTPRNKTIAWLNTLYSKRVMPISATLISRDTSGAYRYLPRSIDTFLRRDELSQLVRDSGFASVTQESLTFGVCVCHRGVAS